MKKRRYNYSISDLKSILIKCPFLEELQISSSIKNFELFEIIINSLNALSKKSKYNKIQNNIENRRNICSMAKHLLKNGKVQKSSIGKSSNAVNANYKEKNEILFNCDTVLEHESLQNMYVDMNCNDECIEPLNDSINISKTQQFSETEINTDDVTTKSLKDQAEMISKNCYENFCKDFWEKLKFVDEFKSDFKKIKDELSKINEKLEKSNDCAIIENNKLENCNKQNFFNILDSANELKVQNNNRDHTLSPFEITNDSLNVSNFLKYRKEANPDEK